VWVSEESFVLAHCFYKASDIQLNAPFNRIIVVTVLILSHKTQKPLTTNDHHTMVTVRTTVINKYYQLWSAFSVTAGTFDKHVHSLSTLTACRLIIGPIILYMSLNITVKIIYNPIIFSGSRTRDTFLGCVISSHDLAVTNFYCPDAIILAC
jgi:hypothetical protein